MKKIAMILLFIFMVQGSVVTSFAQTTEKFYEEYQIWFDSTTGTVTGFQEGITRLALPKKIEGSKVCAIGTEAFYECTTLTEAVLPDSVTTIGDRAFAGCSSLEKITFSSALSVIGEEAFVQCKALREVSFPSSLQTIKSSAFLSCDALTDVTLPKGVSDVGEGVFSYCTNLKKISVSEQNQHFDSENGILFDKEQKTLIQYPAGFSAESYTIPESVTAIGEGAFAYNKHLQSITFPEGLKTIGAFAFFECDGLTELTIPDTVFQIGEEAFGWCDGLSEVVLPGMLREIEYGLFWCTRNLKQIIIPDSVTAIQDYAFAQCESLSSVQFPKGVVSLGKESFAYCRQLTKVDFPESITTVGDRAFADNTSLYRVTARNGDAAFGQDVFDGCGELQFFSPDASAVQAYALARGDLWEKIITVTYMGQEILFDDPPVTRSFRTLVPVRGVFEAMGATVEWIGADRTVAISREGSLIFLTLGSNTLWVNGNAVQMDTEPMDQNGRIFVPVRAITEGLNADLYWDNETQTVSIWEKEA